MIIKTIDIMKKEIWILLLIPTIFSCSKKLDIDTPELNVVVSSSTVKMGEVVKFTLEGNADIISFYSGEIGSDFNFTNTDRLLPIKKVKMSFQSQVRTQGGSATYCQADQFHVMISNNLKFTSNTKEDSLLNVLDATWTNISDKFSLCPLECKSNTPYKYSEQTNIVDLIDLEKPLFIAFKYVNKPNTQNGNATIWRFQSFDLSLETDAGAVSVINQKTAGWKPLFRAENWGSTAFENKDSQITLRGLTSNNGFNELWCVSNSILLETVNSGREFGTTIKSLSDVSLKSYKYQFNQPGTYTVTFVGINTNISGKKQSVCQMTIIVTP